LLCTFRSIGLARLGVSGPIGSRFLKLQPNTKASVGEPLAINHPSEGAQIANKRADHQSFIQLPGPLRQNTHSQRAHIFGRRPLCSGRILEAGNLNWDSQPNPFLKSS